MAHYAPQQLAQNPSSAGPTRRIGCNVLLAHASGTSIQSARGQQGPAAGPPVCMCHVFGRSSDVTRQLSSNGTPGLHFFGEWPLACRLASVRRANSQRSADCGTISLEQDLAARAPLLSASSVPLQSPSVGLGSTQSVSLRPAASYQSSTDHNPAIVAELHWDARAHLSSSIHDNDNPIEQSCSQILRRGYPSDGVLDPGVSATTRMDATTSDLSPHRSAEVTRARTPGYLAAMAAARRQQQQQQRQQQPKQQHALKEPLRQPKRPPLPSPRIPGRPLHHPALPAALLPLLERPRRNCDAVTSVASNGGSTAGGNGASSSTLTPVAAPARAGAQMLTDASAGAAASASSSGRNLREGFSGSPLRNDSYRATGAATTSIPSFSQQSPPSQRSQQPQQQPQRQMPPPQGPPLLSVVLTGALAPRTCAPAADMSVQVDLGPRATVALMRSGASLTSRVPPGSAPAAAPAARGLSRLEGLGLVNATPVDEGMMVKGEVVASGPVGDRTGAVVVRDVKSGMQADDARRRGAGEEALPSAAGGGDLGRYPVGYFAMQPPSSLQRTPHRGVLWPKNLPTVSQSAVSTRSEAAVGSSAAVAYGTEAVPPPQSAERSTRGGSGPDHGAVTTPPHAGGVLQQSADGVGYDDPSPKQQQQGQQVFRPSPSDGSPLDQQQEQQWTAGGPLGRGQAAAAGGGGGSGVRSPWGQPRHPHGQNQNGSRRVGSTGQLGVATSSSGSQQPSRRKQQQQQQQQQYRPGLTSTHCHQHQLARGPPDNASQLYPQQLETNTASASTLPACVGTSKAAAPPAPVAADLPSQVSPPVSSNTGCVADRNVSGEELKDADDAHYYGGAITAAGSSTLFGRSTLGLDMPMWWRRRRRRLVELFPVHRPHRSQRRRLARAAAAAAEASAAEAAVMETFGGVGDDGEVGECRGKGRRGGNSRDHFSFDFTVSRTSDTPIQILPGRLSYYSPPMPLVVRSAASAVSDGNGLMSSATAAAASKPAEEVVSGTMVGMEDEAFGATEPLSIPWLDWRAQPPPLSASLTSHVSAPSASSSPSTACQGARALPTVMGADGVTTAPPSIAGPSYVPSAEAAAAPPQMPTPPASKPYDLCTNPSYVLYTTAAPEHAYVVYRYGTTGRWSWRPMCRVTGTLSPPLLAIALPAVPPPEEEEDPQPDPPAPDSVQCPGGAATSVLQSAASAANAGRSSTPCPSRSSGPAPGAQGPQAKSSPGGALAGATGAGPEAGVPLSGSSGAATTSASVLQVYLDKGPPPPPMTAEPHASGVVVSAPAAPFPSTSSSSGGGSGIQQPQGRRHGTTNDAASAPTPTSHVVREGAAVADADLSHPEHCEHRAVELPQPGHYLLCAMHRPGMAGGGSSCGAAAGGGGGGGSKEGGRSSAALPSWRQEGEAAQHQRAPLRPQASQQQQQDPHQQLKKQQHRQQEQQPPQHVEAAGSGSDDQDGGSAATCARRILRRPVTLVMEAGCLDAGAGGQKQAVWRSSAQALREVWEDSRCVQSGLLMVATRDSSLHSHGTVLSCDTTSHPSQHLLPQPDVVLLGLGTAIAYRTQAPAAAASRTSRYGPSSARIATATSTIGSPSRGGSPTATTVFDGAWKAARTSHGGVSRGGSGMWHNRGDGVWQMDKQWSAILDRLYDAGAVRRAVDTVVRNCRDLWVGGVLPCTALQRDDDIGRTGTSFTSRPESPLPMGSGMGSIGNHDDRTTTQPRSPPSGPAVLYGLARHQGRHRVSLKVHVGSVSLVVRRLEEQLESGVTVVCGGDCDVSGGGGGNRMQVDRELPREAHESRSDDVGSSVPQPPVHDALAAAVSSAGAPAALHPSLSASSASRGHLTSGTGIQVRIVVQPSGDRLCEWCTVDIIPAAAGKAAALRHVLQRYGVDLRMVVAVGGPKLDNDLLAESAAAVVLASRHTEGAAAEGNLEPTVLAAPGLSGFDGTSDGKSCGSSDGGCSGSGGGPKVVIRARRAGPSGVLEGLEQLGLL